MPQPTAIAPNLPPYLQGQRVEGLEGYLHAYINEDEQGQIIDIKANLSVLPLDGQNWGARLSGSALRGLAQYDDLRVRIWGFYTHDKNDQPMINVVNFEKADPTEKVQAWLGKMVTGTVEGRNVILLQTRAGENFVLASSLLTPESNWQYAQEPSWGRQVVQEGVLRPETLGNYRIIQDGTRMNGLSVERMTDLKDYQMQPHPFVSRVPRPTPSGTVELVELIYYTDVAPENVPASATIRPVWRFSGHTSDDRLFEALVEAARQKHGTHHAGHLLRPAQPHMGT